MVKIFEERKMRAAGRLLPYDEFRLFYDLSPNTPPVKEKLEALLHRAEKMLEEPIPMLPLSLFREFFLTGDRAHFESPYNTRRSMVGTLALAEYYEGKGRFTAKLADAIWAILEESSWVVPAHVCHVPVFEDTESVPTAFGDRMHGIDLSSAMTSEILAAAWYLCHDALDGISVTIGQRILYELNERAVKPYMNGHFRWSGEFGNRTNNWNPFIHHHLLVVVALTVKDPYLREKMTEKIMQMLDNFVKFYPEDGGCDEGPGYFGMAGGNYFDALEILYDMSGGRINVFDHPLVRAIGEYEVKFNIAGDRFINFADCAARFTTDGARLVRFGERCGSDILVAFGKEQMYLGGCGGDISYSGMRALLTPRPKEVVPNAATKIWFPNLKVMAARESTDPRQGLFVAMKGGDNNASHNHNDIGNIIVYKNGEPVLIDSGVGTYTAKTFSSQRYELWYMQSSYHNLPDIGGIAQKNGKCYCSSDERYDGETGGVSMEIGAAYPAEAGVLSYRRETLLADGAVTVTDTLSLDGEKPISFHFLSPVAPTAEKGALLLAEGCRLTYSDALCAEIEEFFVEDERLEKSWNSPVLWRISLKTTCKRGTFVFTVR